MTDARTDTDRRSRRPERSGRLRINISVIRVQRSSRSERRPKLDRYAAGKPGDSRCPHFSPPLIDAMFVIRLFSGARSSNPYKLLPVRDGCSVSPLLEFSLLHLDLPGCDCVTMPATPSIEKTSADADIEHNDHTLHDHHERDHGHDVEADPQHLGDEEFGGHEARKKLEKKLLRKLDARMSILIVIYILNYVSSG